MEQYLLAFGIGMAGALITVYARSGVAIPAMRALVDLEPIKEQIKAARESVVAAEADLKRIQSALENGTLAGDTYDRLSASDREGIERAERTIAALRGDLNRYEVWHRGLGFVAYVVLGGVFAALLTGLITIEGVSDELRKVAEPLLLGATWTSYLSVVGFGAVKEEAARTAEETVEETLNRAGPAATTASTAAPPPGEVAREVRARLRGV